MLRATLLLFLFAILAHKSFSKPSSNGPTAPGDSKQQPSTPDERFGVSSSLSFGLNPDIGLGAAGGGNSAYPSTFNIGSGIGGGLGNFGGYNGGSAGSYSPGYNGAIGAGYPTGYNGALGAGYQTGYNGGNIGSYPSGYNAASFGGYPTSYNVNSGISSYPPGYAAGYAPGYNSGSFSNFGSSYGGASAYGSSSGGGYESGFACGSICGEHMRRCSTACSKDFWTYLCVVCVGPKWDSCRSCFS